MITIYALQSSHCSSFIAKFCYKIWDKGNILVLCPTEELRDDWDKILWTFHPTAFLPHARDIDEKAAQQPILLSCAENPLNNAEVLLTTQPSKISDWQKFKQYIIVTKDTAEKTQQEIPQNLKKRCFIEDHNTWRELNL